MHKRTPKSWTPVKKNRFHFKSRVKECDNDDDKIPAAVADRLCMGYGGRVGRPPPSLWTDFLFNGVLQKKIQLPNYELGNLILSIMNMSPNHTKELCTKYQIIKYYEVST